MKTIRVVRNNHNIEVIRFDTDTGIQESALISCTSLLYTTQTTQLNGAVIDPSFNQFQQHHYLDQTADGTIELMEAMDLCATDSTAAHAKLWALTPAMAQHLGAGPYGQGWQYSPA